MYTTTILKSYATKSSESAQIVQVIERMYFKYTKAGINKENICGIVST